MKESEKKKLYSIINLARNQGDDPLADLLKECNLHIDEYQSGAICQDKTIVNYIFKVEDDEIIRELNWKNKSLVNLCLELLEDFHELPMSEDGENYVEIKKAYDLEKLEFAPKHTFENCEKEIINGINNAEHSIFAAIAWITNSNIMNTLIQKSKEGIDIVLLVDKGKNPGDTKNFDFISSQGQLNFLVFPCENINSCFNIEYKNLMHHKFCIIDNKVVYHGTYNWTKKAEFNDENLTKDSNESTIKAFMDRFKQLRIKYNCFGGFNWNGKTFW